MDSLLLEPSRRARVWRRLYTQVMHDCNFMLSIDVRMEEASFTSTRPFSVI